VTSLEVLDGEPLAADSAGNDAGKVLVADINRLLLRRRSVELSDEQDQDQDRDEEDLDAMETEYLAALRGERDNTVVS
jgi:hypothetical protein